MADTFIKIDGIAGESRDPAHPDEIEVIGWHWNVTQQANMHSGFGGGVEKPPSQICTSYTGSIGQVQTLQATAFTTSVSTQPN